MKIHFLGTAAAEGFPNVFCRCEACLASRRLGGKNIRTRASVIVDDTWKFDYSADSQMQALRDQIDMGQIEHLLVTHTHYDHFYPKDLISRSEGFTHVIDHPLHIYGNDLVMHHARQALGQYQGDRFAFQRMKPFQPATIGSATVTPLPADHDPMETCLLYFVEKDGKTLFYGNDTGWFPEETWMWLKGKKIDMAILDCTHGETGNKRSRGHMSADTILEVQQAFAQERILTEPDRIYLTHFTHNSKLLHDDWERLFEPYGIQIAYDGLTVHI
ncbi:MBL fold metallo-hydrolase [Paenibacillus alba]|uniref:MBL fold metallo-hydrolase n=1 Tax=Paenibacillus alba TaxID=1197127 RepID=A0ABU6G0I3_9BACL|nr:MBL fold metallo-hydrolase [Paenibacillus alba]MEC0227672.1 MBL fold metallo-hydrolase [Paenibacillus alba]